MLILAVAINLDELLQNGGMASIAPLSKLSGVVKVTIDLSFMFIVRVLSTKHRGTH